MTNWLGRTLHRPSEQQARSDDIDALLEHPYFRDRSDRRALASCCAVLSSSYRQKDDCHPQLVHKLHHYHAWCNDLGVLDSDRDERTAIAVMALWVGRCKYAAAPGPR